MPTFTWGSYKGSRDRFGRTTAGMTATRYGKIDTSDVRDAAAASGIPAIGDAFHTTAYPTLTVRKIDIEPLVGGQTLGLGIAPASANPGVSEVTISYDTGGGGTIKNPKPTVPGEAWTEIDVGSSSQTVYYGHDIADTANANTNVESIPAEALAGPLNDGDGVTLDVPTLSLSVVKSYAATSSIPFSSWVALAGKINSASVTLPPLYKTGTGWTLAKGQLLYVLPKIEAQGDLIVVRHQFVAAPDHNQRLQERGPDGTVAKRQTVRLRNYADLSGLV
jgi:hypothetical protein